MVASMEISIETEYLSDAIDDLREIQRRLVKMHGADFRNLDRRISDFSDAPDDFVRLHWLGGSVVAAAAGELTAILAEARRLDII